jgi:hypothetical protein
MKKTKKRTSAARVARRSKTSPRVQIPTGSPRLFDSGKVRERLAVEQVRATFFREVLHSTLNRLELLEDVLDYELLPCPRGALVTCSPICRCDGAGTLPAGAIRANYIQIVAEMRGALRRLRA